MNLKIFKLRSGEEVICQIIEETKNKFKVSDPLVFRTSTMTDHHGTYDMTVLRDWLTHTENKTTFIPKNHIVVQCDPKEDTKKLYSLQLETERTMSEKVVSIDNSAQMDNLPDVDAPPQDQIFQDFLDALLNNPEAMNEQQYDPMVDNYTPKSPRPRRRKSSRRNNMPSPEMNPNEMDRHGIYVSMMLPSEAIMNLITAGLLDPKDILRMIKEVKRKNRFTGDEKDRKDYGSKFSDWNPDPSSDEYK
jgi:hypothetical protein